MVARDADVREAGDHAQGRPQLVQDLPAAARVSAAPKDGGDALDALGQQLSGRTLQIACVYGDLTRRLLERLSNGASLDVVDILPIQLENLARKLPPGCGVSTASLGR